MKKELFVKWGEKGGKKRARRLTRLQRSEIASRAARARWKKKLSDQSSLESIRFNNPKLSNPAFLEEILANGSLTEWKKLYNQLNNHPFGEVASSLENVLSSTTLYGVTPLWKGLLNVARGTIYEEK